MPFENKIDNYVKGAETMEKDSWGFSLTPFVLILCLIGLTGCYKISGSIKAVEGVPVYLSGKKIKSTSTDDKGKYKFTRLKAGDYTVTPQQEGYFFNPQRKAVRILDEDVSGVNFERYYFISGIVQGGSEGVKIQLNGTASMSTITDEFGTFVFSNLKTGQYTITPSKDGHIYKPANKNIVIEKKNVSDLIFVEQYHDIDVFWSDSTLERIYSMDRDGNNNNELVKDIVYPLDLQIEGEELCWTGNWIWSNHTSVIVCSDFTGSNQRNVTSDKEGRIFGFAIAPDKREFYFTRRLYQDDVGQILRLDSNGQIRVIKSGLMSPRGIEIDPIREKIYWADQVDGIFSSNLDGTETEKLTNQQAYMLALDPQERALYFTSFNSQTDSSRSIIRNSESSFSSSIMKLSIVDKQLETLVENEISPKGIKLDLGEKKIYWAASGTEIKGVIKRSNLNGENVEVVSDYGRGPHGIALYYGCCKPYTISGVVDGISNVDIHLSGPSVGKVATDILGEFIFTGLKNGNYTLSPKSEFYDFDPKSINMRIEDSNISGIKFNPIAVEGLSEQEDNYLATLPDVYLSPDEIIMPNGSRLSDPPVDKELFLESSAGDKLDFIQKIMLRKAKHFACARRSDPAPCTDWDREANIFFPDWMPAQKGLTYVFGGKNPYVRSKPIDSCNYQLTAGIDCSGLITNIAEFAGIEAKGNVVTLSSPDNWKIPSGWGVKAALVKNVPTVPSDILLWPKHIGIAEIAAGSNRFISSTGGPNRCFVNILPPRGPRSLPISAFKGTPKVLRFVETHFYDGKYTSCSKQLGDYTHKENAKIVNSKIELTHKLFKGGTQVGSFYWKGTLEPDPENFYTAKVTGEGIIDNVGQRPFTLKTGRIEVRPNGSIRLGWTAIDPKFGPIGGVSYRKNEGETLAVVDQIEHEEIWVINEGRNYKIGVNGCNFQLEGSNWISELSIEEGNSSWDKFIYFKINKNMMPKEGDGEVYLKDPNNSILGTIVLHINQKFKIVWKDKWNWELCDGQVGRCDQYSTGDCGTDSYEFNDNEEMLKAKTGLCDEYTHIPDDCSPLPGQPDCKRNVNNAKITRDHKRSCDCSGYTQDSSPVPVKMGESFMEWSWQPISSP
ncbi:SdrD B-like domain-containing protein [Desulforhopalus sp. 52FAK]